MNKLPFLLVAIATGLFTSAQNDLPVKKITIFKNATAFMIKEGTVPVKEGNVLLPVHDNILYGTYFIGSGKDNSIREIVYSNDTLKKKTSAQTTPQLLGGNLNKPVTIYYTPTQGLDKSLTGRAISYDIHSGMLKFATDAGKFVAINVSKIYEADFKEDPSSYFAADSIERVMQLKPEKAADNLSLQEIYMCNGINWLPSYYLKLQDDKTARLEMKAVIENYAEEFKDASVELVVGAPQMKFSGMMDPMTYNYITTGGTAAPKEYKSSNANARMVLAEAETVADDYFATNFTTGGEKTSDMYIYKLGKISLPYRAKGSFPIFAGTVEYKDKYEGSIPDFVNYYNNKNASSDDKSFDVFHSLEIKNTSTVPLTTAPIMVTNDKEQFIAQDELKYTPAGSTAGIRLSKAVDIIMKDQEEVQSRMDNAQRIGRVIYSDAVLKGTVTVQNFQNKEVTVTVTKAVNGNIIFASDNGHPKMNKSYNYVNPNSEIKWDITLAPSEKRTVGYEYEVLFRP